MESLKYLIIVLLISSATILAQPSGDVSFLNANVGWVEGGGVGKKTTDGGITWTTANIINGRFQFTSESTANAVSGYSFYRTTDGGSSWVAKDNYPNQLFDISMVNQNLGFACGMYGRIYKTTDAGMNWYEIYTINTLSYLFSIYFYDQNFGFVTAGDGTILLKTTNGGYTWTKHSNDGSTLQHHDVHFPTPTTGYIASEGGKISKTTDGGLNWTTNTISSTSLEAVNFYSENLGLVGDSFGKIWKTTDGGYTWTEIIANATDRIERIQFISASTAIVSVRNGNQIRLTNLAPELTVTSPNGTESWQAGSTQNITWTSSGVTSVKLEYTTDGGINWNSIIASTPTSSGSYPWTIPSTPSPNCKVRISDALNSTITDTSDTNFKIILGNGLIAYYPFNGNVTDESGNGNNATNKGATLTTDRFGNDNSAYSFDGNGQFISVIEKNGFAELTNPAVNFSISAWIKTTSNLEQCIFSNSSEDGWNQLYVHNSFGAHITNTSWSGTDVASLDSVSDNNWHFVSFVFASPIMKIFSDGKLQGSASFAGTLLSSGAWVKGGVKIGAYYDLPTCFKGSIDDIRIYNRVLTQAEIDSLYYEGGYNSITYGGKVYHSVTIGTQTWLKENLDFGVMIQGTANPSNNGTVEKYCYDNNPANCDIYGGLYQWNEAMAYTTTPDVKGICPTGWHIPTKTEFETLKVAVNNDGNALKAVGQGTGSGAGTNTSGFSALLTGYSGSNSYFFNIGNGTNIWSSTSTEVNTTAWYMSLWNDGSNIYIVNYFKDYGLSVRCLKDESPTASLQLTSPNGGENWQAGTTQNITWTSSGVTDVKLESTTNNGTNWSTIIASTSASSGSYAWTAPSTPSSNCIIRISDANNALLSDESDSPFTITGLVAYYPFNGNANDESGNENNPSFNNATLTTDRFGNPNSAYYFNGTDSYIVIPNSPAFNDTSAISITLWARLKSDAPYYFPYHIIEKDTTWSLGQRGDSIVGGIKTSDGQYYVTTSPGLDYGIYKFITMIYDGDSSKLFVNGGLVSGSSQQGHIRYSTGDIFIGQYTYGGDYYFEGTLDDIRIYNRAITNTEIDSLYYEGGYNSITYGGKVYHTITIGNQTWLKENLDIGEIISSAQPQSNNNIIEKYCYNNITANCDTFGGRYQWDELMQYVTTEGSRGICPIGWHIPKKSDFDSLIVYVNNDGNALKAVGQGTATGVGTNLSGFSGLLMGGHAYFHSSTENGTNLNYGLGLWYDQQDPLVYASSSGKLVASSVRCLKDESPTASLQITSPNGSETWQSSSTQNITWKSSGVTNVKLEYTTNSGTDWATIIASTPASSGSYAWTIPNTPSTNCKVRISDVDYLATTDVSDNVFTINGMDSITYGGKIYHTVKIGSQTWLRENLDIGVYVQSTNTGSDHTDVSNNGIIEKYCYGNNEANCATYGGLYDWNEAMQYVTTEKAKGICPTGWHIPTKGELETLLAAVDNDGNKLKREDQGTGAGVGTNTSGFSALLAGYRGSFGTFANLGVSTYYWCSTKDVDDARMLWLRYFDNYFSMVSIYKEQGYSVRCLKDESPVASLQVISPNGSVTWQAGSTQNITWTSSGVTNVKLEYTTNSGTNWTTLVASTPASSGSYAWTIPNTPSTQCKVRATDVTNTALFDVSDTTFTISDGNWIVYNTSNSSLPHNSIKSIAVDNAGVKWIGTENGLAKFDGTNWNVYTTSNSSLPYNYVSAIAIDDAGNKWIGTFSRYLAKFDNTNWTVYNTNDWGLPIGAIQALAIDASGNKWIGTSEGLAKFDGTTGTIFTPSNSGLPNKSVRSIAIDEQGNKWIGTLDSGLVKFDGTNWTVYKTTNSQIPNNQVHAIAISKYGNKWLGTTGGFAKYDGSNWNVYDRSANYLDNWVFAATIDNSGNKWTGSLGGVGLFDGTNWTSYRTTNSGLPDTLVNAIAIDATGNKWFGTNAGGVAVLKAGTTIDKTISLITPNGSESWQAGTAHNIAWTNLNVTNVKLEYTTNSGTTWTTIIASNSANSGSYAWTVPNTSATTCRVRISDASNNDLTDKSDNVFTITKIVAAPTNLTASAGNKQVSLKWNKNSETDLRVYRIYGGTSANPANKVDSITYVDTTKTIFNLTNGTKYYYRITAVDSTGNESGYSNEISAVPNETITYGGKIYHTVKIGTQTWLKENLDIGTMIQGTANPSNSGTIEKYCYDNLPANCDTYGGLYQWNEAMAYTTASGTQGICPTGWHVPTKEEFQTLKTGVNNDGDELKAIGQGNGNNKSEFSALLAGDVDFYFHNLGSFTSFWSSTDDINNSYASTLTLGASGNFIDLNGSLKQVGFSVRCLKDESPIASIQLTSPNGGESFVAETVDTIKWTSTNVTNVKLEYTTNSGTIWSTIIASSPASSGSYAWLIPTVSSTACKVRLSDVANSSVTDTSDNIFSINYVNGYDSITYAGKIYHTVKIGNQTWLKENLDIGTMIQGNVNATNNGTIEKYCYDNNPANCDTYGGLYQWNEAMQYVTTEKAKGICPTGWHIPSNIEYRSLVDFVGDSVDVMSFSGSNSLKAVGQGVEVGSGTNSTGFSGLLAGFRRDESPFYSVISSWAYLWTSTEFDLTSSYYLGLNAGNNLIYVDIPKKLSGSSIRCLKDESPTATLKIISPNGGESFVAETVDTIKWTSSGVTNVKLEYTNNNGTNWSTIIASTPANSNRYAWLIPTSSSTNCKVRLIDVSNSSVADTSDNVFTINYVNGYDSLVYGGKTYHTVKIGNQTWLKENLDIGTMIQGMTNPSNNGTIEKYCYNNLPANCETYGGLYQWNEAMAYSTTPGVQGICPDGWHIPTKTEFDTLATSVSNNSNPLKAVGEGTAVGAGTNTSGFSALLAGYRDFEAYFVGLGDYATYFWSSTEYDAVNGNGIGLYYDNSNINMYNGNKGLGFSIRCLKDETPIASIQLTSPNGGESFVAGTVHTIEWMSTVVTNVKLEYTTNSGTNWATIIASTPASSGSYAWILPTVSSANCKVRISDVTNSLLADTSDNVFTINYVSGYDSITYGGKIYHTVKIGNQTWLKENLDIGTMIQGSTNQIDNLTIEKYCYNNNLANCDTYGGLYQWNEAMAFSTTQGTQGICPTGWHIATRAEFEILESTVGNNGNSLKAIGEGSGDGAGTNSSGFTALLSGLHHYNGNFIEKQTDAYFWTSTENATSYAYYKRLLGTSNNISLGINGYKMDAFSIRCIKTDSQTASIQITTPNGGESFIAGTVDTIEWTSTNVTSVKLEYTSDTGTNWTPIIASTPASVGSYVWTIPNTPSSQCKVKISDVTSSSIADTSGTFTITAQVQKITVTSPNGGERWKGNSSQQITWGMGSGKSTVSSKKSEVRIQNEEESKISGKLKVKSGKLNFDTDDQLTTNNKLLTTNNSIENVRIDYSTNNGVNWITVANGVSAVQNNYNWLVPKVNSQNCKVRVVDQIDTTIADTSDAVFEIYSPQIMVTSPNGGEQWQSGSTHAITWTQSNIDTVKISYSTNQGTGWIAIVEKLASAGTYSWVVPSTISSTCKVKISDKADSTFADSSNAVFAITSIPVVQVLVTSPNGGENWKVGEIHNVTWSSSNVDSVKIELTTNNGTNWTTIKDSVKASLGSFAWTIPNTPSTQCKVRIRDFKNSAVGDTSNAVFTIELLVQKTIAVTSPNGGESWKVGSAQSITWTSSNVNKFKLEYTSNNGTTWLVVGYSSSSPYSWIIPNTASVQCKVRISDSTNAAVWDTSKAVFTIIKPSVAVVYPNGGEELQVGSNINVTWLSSNVQNVSVEYSSTNKRTWNTISASVAASSQSISWTVPDAVSDSCFIKIKDVSDNSVADTSNAKFKIIPSSPPSLTLTSPVGNEQWKLGTKHFITWTKNKVTTVKIEFSSNDGSSWSTLTSSAVADSGKYEWTVPNTASTVCRIKISDADNALLYSVSPLPFELYYTEIVLTAPNGGEEWMVSETHAITWTSLHVNKVKVELTTDNGANWTVQKDSATASMGNVTWVVPNIPATSTECKIKISDANDPTVSDVSEQVFTIKGLPKLQVISPKAGDVWEIGTTQAITWYRENLEQIKIELSTNSGSDWMNIASSVQASDQSYSWEVQNYLSQNCRVRISDVANPSFSDTSDVFSIVAKVKPVVLTPNGGEKLTLGQAYDITWKLGSGKLIAPKVPSFKSGNSKGTLELLGTASTSNIRIQLSTDDGVSWAEIKNQIAVDSAKFTWTVSGEPSDKCFIKIVDINDASNFDLSDSAFGILDNKIPNILVSTNSLDFGNVYQDSTEIKEINITNTGMADLQIQSTSFYQTSSAYKVTTFSQTIKPDSTRDVSITFMPTELISYSDTLYVYHNAAGSPAKIALTGSGIEVPKPAIKVSVTSVTFDTTYIGSNNQKTIAIDNEGTADLTVTSITTNKSVFSPTETSFTVGAGLRHILTLNFAPTSDSSYSGTLSIQHNAAGSPSALSLVGQGKKHVPNIVLSSKEINFGVITVYTHIDASLTINNSGTADLVVTNISSSNNRFVTNLSSFTIKPNESKEITLTFTPVSAVQYSSTLTISHNAGVGVSIVPMNGAGYPVDVTVTRTITFGDISLSGNYRMVGLPGNSNIPITQTVSGSQKSDWNAYYDNGVISANQSDYLKEYDGSSKYTFKPGNGFWIVSKNGLTVSANVQPVPLAVDSTYSIPLQANWNIISNPFEKSTSWTKIKQLNGLTTHPLYKWNGLTYDQVSEMTTYEGFYFYNTSGLTSLKIPYDANGTLKKFFKVRDSYQLGERGFTINCVGGGIERSSIYAGFNAKSSNDVDDYDYFMPPADFGEVTLVLQNDSLATDYKKLIVEQRKEIGEGTQFDFTAKNNSKEEVQLTINGIEFFPESETYLLDKQYNKFTNLKEKSVFTLPQQMGKRSYALLVGSPSFIQERKAKIIPTEYLLYQNFPNPFNPATTIAFGLPKESNVTLTLYNMLGEVVLKNELGSKSSGYHEWLLDLSSKTSGVYFYAIHANALDGSKSFREVKKMMLVK